MQKRKQSLKGKLPDFWQRLGRTEAQKMPFLKTLEKRKVKNGIQRDKKEKWPRNRTLALIESFLEFPIKKHISERIGKFTEEKPFKVLDLGCGTGRALLDLKREFGKKIKTVGLTLVKIPKDKYEGIDRLLVGSLKNTIPMEQFNFIFSHQGATYHTKMELAAIEKAIALLKPGGTALLDLQIFPREEHGKTLEEKMAKRSGEIYTLMAQHGIKDFSFGYTSEYFDFFYDGREVDINCKLVLTKPIPKLP